MRAAMAMIVGHHAVLAAIGLRTALAVRSGLLRLIVLMAIAIMPSAAAVRLVPPVPPHARPAPVTARHVAPASLFAKARAKVRETVAGRRQHPHSADVRLALAMVNAATTAATGRKY